MSETPPFSFDRGRLSAREDAILDFAIEGLIDAQIALRLEIAESTVNSYWVRIRGKLGQLSRTELVALALKQKAQVEIDAMRAERDALREEARRHARFTSDYANAEVFRAALDAMPEAVFASCAQGIVRYANARLEALFGYAEGELVGKPLETLLPTGERERLVEAFESPRPMRIGVDRVVYGRRRSGELFRIILLIDSRPTSAGPIFSGLVRDFASEIETRRHHVSAWS